MAKIITDEDFNLEIKDGVVVVDFYADWCNPCKMLAPIFEELESEMEGKAKFLKVDVAERRDIADRFKIRTIPTILIFRKSNKMDMIVGFTDKESLKEKIEKYI